MVNKFAESSVFELKQTTKDSLLFSAVKDHQIAALLAASGENALIYKAPDDTRNFKPFDLFYMRRCGAYIVIKYPKVFCVIRVTMFLYEKRISDRKSLTSERAIEISMAHEVLK